MNRLSRAATVAVASLALIATLPAVAHAATPVEDCLAAMPGAVTVENATDGDDTVCVDANGVLQPSPGDDTYLWVGAENGGHIDTPRVPDSSGTPQAVLDPGHDILSLELWTAAFTKGQFNDPDDTYVAMVDVEGVRYTPFSDNVGSLVHCNLQSQGSITYETLGGDDTVQCVHGTLYTGDGNDTISGVSWAATVYAGAGDDHVDGDGDGDRINLGEGEDTVDVAGGGIDEVWGGPGIDTNLGGTTTAQAMTFAAAAAPRRDVFHSVERGVPSTKPKPVARPAVRSRLLCQRKTTVRRIALVNRRSTRPVTFRVANHRPAGRTVRSAVTVPAGQVRYRQVRARGKRNVADVDVRAAGRVWHLNVVRGARCA